MAGGSCCASKHRRKWAVLATLAAFMLCGSAIFLYISIAPLSKSLNCAISKLSALAASAGSAGATAASAIPAELLSPVKSIVPFFDFASMGPALISMVFLLSAVGFASCNSFCCSKILILLCQPLLVATLAWNVAMVGAALFADRAVLRDQWAKITVVCTTNLPNLNAALATATSDLASSEAASASAAQLATAQGALIAAQSQVDDFSEMCTCLDTVLTDVKGLLGAGLLGLCAAILALVAVNGLCCATGCCRKPKNKVAPASSPGKGSTKDLDDSEEGDEDDEDDK